MLFVPQSDYQRVSAGINLTEHTSIHKPSFYYIQVGKLSWYWTDWMEVGVVWNGRLTFNLSAHWIHTEFVSTLQ